MANRDVTITLKVKDGEVVAATSSLNRMKAAAKDAGLTEGLRPGITAAEMEARNIATAAKRAGVSYEEMASRVKHATVGVREAEAAINATARAASKLASATSGASAGLNRAFSPTSPDGGRRAGITEAEMQARAIASAAKRAGVSYEEMASRVKRASTGVRAAESAINDTSEAATNLVPATGGAAAGFGRLVAALGPVGAALLAVGAVIGGVIFAGVKLGRTVLNIAKSFSDFTLELDRTSRDIGLSIQMTAALRQQAEATGESFGLVESALQNFRRTIGQAAAGSDVARLRLNLLGIDGRKAIDDLDGAFQQAIVRIAELPTQFEQAKAAYAAFGQEGYKLLPFINSFNGDIDELIVRARELGLVIGGDDVKAAREFNRAYADVKAALTDLKNTFGREFLPVVRDVIRDFTGWLKDNKSEIKAWASGAAEWVQFVIDKFKDLKWFMDATSGVDKGFIAKNPELKNYRGGRIVRDLPPLAAPVDANQFYGTPTRVPGVDTAMPDPAALEAMRQEAERLQKERVEAMKAELAAQISLYDMHIARVEKLYADGFQRITEAFKETGNVELYQQQFDVLKAWYGGTINDLAGEWQKLVERQTMAEKTGQFQRQEEYEKTENRIRDLAEHTHKFEQQAAKNISDQRKKATAEQIREFETAMNRRVELSESRSREDIARIELDQKLEIASEEAKIKRVNMLEMEALEFRRRQLQEHLANVKGTKEQEAEIEHRLAIVKSQIAIQEMTNADRLLEFKKKQQEEVNRIRERYEEFQQALEDQIDVLLRGERPLTQYQQTIRALERDYKELEPAQKQHLLDLSMQVDLLDALNERHKELKEFFSQTFRYAFDGDLSGLFENFQRTVKDRFIDNISDWLATNLLGFDPNQTDNPVAKPIVGKIGETNKRLDRMIMLMGGSAGGSAGVGGFLSRIFSGIGGGGGGAGLGSAMGGSAIGGLLGLGGRGGNPLDGLDIGSGGFDPRTGTYNNAASGSIWKRLTGPGGIFGDKGFGNNVGTYGGIGSLAGIAGGLIGGRVGGIFSSVGTGLALGAQIGSIIPGIGTAIGAAVGAIGGLFAGLLGGDPKRKADKRQNIPALNSGFADAIAQLREILTGVRRLSLDPDEAVSRANEVRAQIASGFGIQFQSKKYRRQAQTMIAAKLREADDIISQIRGASDIARGAADRRQRILPEFAGGFYFPDYFRPNGLIPGVFDGRDDLLAMLSRGEMVINDDQQNDIRKAAGFDVFAEAGIPNYPKASSSPKLARGGIVGTGLALGPQPNVIVEPRFSLYVEGVNFDERARAWIESDGGRRHVVKLVKKARKERDI